jgi:hypothetical protein
MKIFGFILMALGAYLAYSGYRRKFIKAKEGQTLEDVQKEMLSSEANDAYKKAMGVGCSAYLKVMSIVAGVFLFFMGLIVFLLF